MRNQFAKTSNVKAFMGAYSRVEDRGAREASWLFVGGVPGLGKTRTVMWFGLQIGAVYVRAKANWNTSWMLQEIATELGLDAGGRIKDLFAQVLGSLASSGRHLIIDEARNLLHDVKLLETLRDLSDTSEAVIILSGEDFVLKRLTTRYPQIRSRITETVEFRPASIDDVRLVCDELCEIKVADDLVAEIHKQSRGFLREVKNAVANVERFGKSQGVTSIDLGAVAGRQLCQDRDDARTRQRAGL
ncbi:MAG TPA: ATP-binding protein [Aliidongia sp.]|uniref:ATP-binding protein n=1 Tax=Aliidongia sp. TaxID=1914230 RepID=UPI002DDD4771|nr:ATP-binding protein [Aliidongia sp.]HEV2675516.1 ATP-binding protein [Aliidongia sp.]